MSACQLEDQKQAQIGNTFDDDEAPNSMFARLRPQKRLNVRIK